MLSRSRNFICAVVATCSVFLLLVLNFEIQPRLPGVFSKAHKGNRQGVDNSTLGFEAVLVINAPWRTDRRDSITLATAYTGIKVDWIDGLNASNFDERAYPQGSHRALPKGNLGSWRAHMNAIRTVVEQNLGTALILEDDTDWDPRARSQLVSFGVAAQSLPSMIAKAELATHERIIQDQELDSVEVAKRSASPLPSTSSTLSNQPYGNDWDVLWLGHCGASHAYKNSSQNHMPDRLIQLGDPTVLAPQSTSSPSPYPSGTRIYHRAHSNLCTLAYAVTQRGARKILYEHGIRNLDKGYDFALSEWCDGETKHMGERPMCLTSSPSVFGHYWPENDEVGGGRSDISGLGREGVAGKGKGLMRGVRGDLGALMSGEHT